MKALEERIDDFNDEVDVRIKELEKLLGHKDSSIKILTETVECQNKLMVHLENRMLSWEEKYNKLKAIEDKRVMNRVRGWIANKLYRFL